MFWRAWGDPFQFPCIEGGGRSLTIRLAFENSVATSSIIIIIGFGSWVANVEVDGQASLVDLARADYSLHHEWQAPNAAQQPASTAPSSNASEPHLSFGEVGARYFYVHGGGGSDLDTGHMARGGFGWSEFIARDFSLDMELSVLYFNQDGPDAVGVNFNMILRWHFWFNEDRTWSLYADAGAGLMLATADVPEDGSSFCFTPQLGFGMSFDVESNRRLLAGLRWHHVSNANTFEDNPGRDGVLLYLMLAIPY